MSKARDLADLPQGDGDLITNGNVGIGTSSPEGDGLHVQAPDNNNDDDLISLGFTFDANSRVLGTIGVHNSASNAGGLKFSTKNAGTLAERMRINANGNTLIGTTTDNGVDKLQVNGSVSATSIKLGGTGAANTLDDYEEGTWNPTVTNSGTNPTLTYLNRSGTYTKVGRMVTVVCNLRLNVTNVGSGSCYVGGLPFGTATNYAGVAWGIDNAFSNGYALGGGYVNSTTVFTGNELRVLSRGYITFTATYETA